MTDPFTVGVTGAAGYTGARVVQELQATHPDWRVLAIDNFYQGTVREVGGVTVRHVDIRDRRQLVDSLRGVDAVCHLAAVSGVEDCDERSELSYEVNVVGTNNVAWLCRKLGAGLIFAASMAIFGDPEGFPITADQSRAALNWYGRTKILGEAAVEQFATGSFPAFVFVKSNLYGSYSVGDSTVSKEAVINYFLRRARNEQSITVYEPGTQSRNFVHVADVARSYVRGLERMREHLREGETGRERLGPECDDRRGTDTNGRRGARPRANGRTRREPPVRRDGGRTVRRRHLEDTRRTWLGADLVHRGGDSQTALRPLTGSRTATHRVRTS